MRRSYALRLLLPLTLVDLLTLAVLVQMEGPRGEANPIVAAVLSGGLVGAAIIKGAGVVAALGFEAFVTWDQRPSWGPRFVRIASVPIAFGIALNVASLVGAVSAGAFA